MWGERQKGARFFVIYAAAAAIAATPSAKTTYHPKTTISAVENFVFLLIMLMPSAVSTSVQIIKISIEDAKL